MTDKTEPQIQLNDLYAVVQIIDACSERGAFKGSELELVGGIRSRLSAFVDAHKPKTEEEPEVELDTDES